MKKNSMTKAEILSATEETLWQNYSKTKDPAIRDEIVRRYAFLVKSVVGKMAAGLSKNVEFDDLLSYGTMGLLDAIEKFDPKRKLKFSTYAMTRIRGHIFDELRNIDWIPRSVRQKYKNIELVYSELQNKLNKQPEDEEMAKELGVSVEEYHKMLVEISSTAVFSLNDFKFIGDDDDEVPVIDTVEGHKNLKPDQISQRDELKKVITEAIEELPEKEKQIVVLYYYEELTLKEIGEILELTESRVSQLHGKAMLRLRARLLKFRDYVE